MNYQGYLLAAHPKRRDLSFRRAVALVINHSETACIGLLLNKQIVDSISIQSVMENMDIVTDLDGPVYWGGSEAGHRITVVHSLDWYSANTSKITEELGVSNDISVLTALASARGPRYYRVVAGHVKWALGELEGEISGEPPWYLDDTWSWCPGSLELVFNYSGSNQWHQVISSSASYQVSEWFV